MFIDITSKKLIKSLPSAVTLIALSLGLWSIKFTLTGEMHYAMMSILAAIVLDGMDGKIARYLSSDSQFGAILDTLADFANFGIAPAFFIYYNFLMDTYKISWLAILFFVICMAIRLARFSAQSPGGSKIFFTGVPAPGGASLSLTGAFFYMIGIELPAFAHILILLISGLLIVSKFPTIAVTKIKIPRDFLIMYLLAGSMILSLFFIYPWHTLILINISYLLTMPKCSSWLKQQVSADANKA